MNLRNGLLVVKQYKNWLSIVLMYLLHKKPNLIILRNSNIKIPGNSKVPLEHLAVLLGSGWVAVDINGNYLTLKSPEGYKIKARVSQMSDLFGLVETFENKVYGEDFKDKLVVDVGMYIADSSIYFIARGAKKIIGIEPSRASYDLAMENIAINSLQDKIIAINAAVSDRQGEARLVIAELPQSNYVSALKGGDEENIIVKTLTIHNIMEDNHIDVIDFLKVDCEGCEYDIIKTLDDVTLSKILQLAVEYHKGCDIIRGYLEKNGFTVKTVGTNRKGHLYAQQNLS